jgi:hypothetical protein
MELIGVKWCTKEISKMLLGTFEPNLIGKNRLGLPAKLLKEIKGNRVVL